MHKNIITFASTCLSVLAFLASCEELGRIDQIDESAPAPKAATVTSVESKPGGAIIRFTIPNDDNLMGVKAVFERNGETCESMAGIEKAHVIKVDGVGVLAGAGIGGLLFGADREIGSLEEGKLADFVVCDRDWKIGQVVIGGKSSVDHKFAMLESVLEQLKEGDSGVIDVSDGSVAHFIPQ